MSIRIATKQDAHDLAELVGSLSHYYLEDPNRPLPEWFLSSIQPGSFESRLQSPDYLNLVYEEADEIKGYIAIKAASHLYHLFVSEELHGKGIAKQLWQQAKSMQPKSQSYALRSSLYAVPVYLKFGFTKSGPVGVKDGISFQPMTLGTKS
ncbi:MAG TPA: GNAT family N-acetyltransferase [Methylophaga aminisulfidivorans]|uniref:GNAT family N-acetyltransferase n=1 Tax=Methylophaga TaxID=40222 RepID=UPI00175C13FA|nr:MULTISPECIES: GNAT family N-acetyltransferase [Methylophaga]HIC47624.1 GNAT family N-acetyltransferase [Methylophaga sp.]HIM39045.1 GNAT family N-acetyltransferase [Methylophaga aminisulfidivorans]